MFRDSRNPFKKRGSGNSPENLLIACVSQPETSVLLIGALAGMIDSGHLPV
jgi:hypothetical protein